MALIILFLPNTKFHSGLYVSPKFIFFTFLIIWIWLFSTFF